MKKTIKIIKLQLYRKCSLHTQPAKELPGWLTFCFPRTPVSWWATGHRGGGVEGILHQDSPFQAKVTCWSQFSRRPRKEGKCTDLGTVEWVPGLTKPKAEVKPIYVLQSSQSFQNMTLSGILPHCPRGPCLGLSGFCSGGGYTLILSSPESTESTYYLH